MALLASVFLQLTLFLAIVDELFIIENCTINKCDKFQWQFAPITIPWISLLLFWILWLLRKLYIWHKWHWMLNLEKLFHHEIIDVDPHSNNQKTINLEFADTKLPTPYMSKEKTPSFLETGFHCTNKLSSGALWHRTVRSQGKFRSYVWLHDKWSSMSIIWFP